jgi:hypothetical protein
MPAKLQTRVQWKGAPQSAKLSGKLNRVGSVGKTVISGGNAEGIDVNSVSISDGRGESIDRDTPRTILL